jgi:hypothetical protein
MYKDMPSQFWLNASNPAAAASGMGEKYDGNCSFPAIAKASTNGL